MSGSPWQFAWAGQARKFAGRVEDYGWLRRDQRLPLALAAERMGVSERTAWRYERALREQPAAA